MQEFLSLLQDLATNTALRMLGRRQFSLSGERATWDSAHRRPADAQALPELQIAASKRPKADEAVVAARSDLIDAGAADLFERVGRSVRVQ